MTKTTLDEAQELSGQFDLDLGAIANLVHGAVKKMSTGPALEQLIERGKAKVRQFDDVVGKLSAIHARQFKDDYEKRVDRLRSNIAKLEDKQGKA